MQGGCQRGAQVRAWAEAAARQMERGAREELEELDVGARRPWDLKYIRKSGFRAMMMSVLLIKGAVVVAVA